MTNFADLLEMLLFEILEIRAKEHRLKKVTGRESALIPLFLLGKEDGAITEVLKVRGFQLRTEEEASQGLCLTELTLGRLSRVANLAPQDWQEELIISCLSAKKTVFVCLKGCDYRQQLAAAPFKLQQKIRDWEASWEAFGGIFLKVVNNSTEPKVLTAKRVQEQLLKGDSNFAGFPKQLITPLAQELIADYHRLRTNQK